MPIPVPLKRLRQLYYDEHLTPAEIALRLGTSRQAVYERFRNNGISLRAGPSKTELTELYVNQELTIKRIAETTGYGTDKITGLLDEYQIPRSYRRNSKHKAIIELEVGERTTVRQESGRYPTSVLKLAKKKGIRVVTRKIDEKTYAVIRTPKLDKENVRKMKNEGMTKTKIAETFLATRQTIARMLR